MKKPEKTMNMQITNVSLSMADHGCLTYMLTLVGDGIGVGFGGYCLGHGYLGASEFDADGKGLVAMMKIMDVVGVERWEDLKGKHVRVNDDGWGGTVYVIGNIIEDKWFDQKEFFGGGK